MLKQILFALAVAVAAPMSVSAAPPPIEAYGALPQVSNVAISPSGKRFASLRLVDGRQSLIVNEMGKGVISGVFTDSLKARGAYFFDEDHVILIATMTTTLNGLTEPFEYATAFAHSLKTKKTVELLSGTVAVLPQGGISSIIGKVERGGKTLALMPAWAADASGTQMSANSVKSSRALFEVDLDSGRGVLALRGTRSTRNFIVNGKGEVVAREDFDDQANKYAVYARNGRDWAPILQESAEISTYGVVGLAPDEKGLIMQGAEDAAGFEQLSYLGFDGVLKPENTFKRPNRSIAGVIRDSDRRMVGVAYDGMFPEYAFADPALDEAVLAAQSALPNVAVSLAGWTKDFSKLLVFASGSGDSGTYFVFDRVKNELQKLASQRPDIKPEQVGLVLAIEYKARDGLKIPAVLTLPPGGESKNLPLVVLPHGGPELYDTVGFDWMAQYFASRGYMVLQPNFRGSTGFGNKFRDAGRGEWGAKMQDDVSDGVAALVRTGRADPKRVCIMGWSYGGYSALAGGAFTPSLYQCVVAGAPVSDIPAMLEWSEENSGKRSWVISYWSRVIGDPKKQLDKLRRISPVNSAGAYQAPLLLIHGRDDTVVPFDQSERMERAMRASNKPVAFVKLSGEDHWLSGGKTRLEMLKAAGAFVDGHIGAN